jgi:hypothetical protein
MDTIHPCSSGWCRYFQARHESREDVKEHQYILLNQLPVLWRHVVTRGHQRTYSTGGSRIYASDPFFKSAALLAKVPFFKWEEIKTKHN